MSSSETHALHAHNGCFKTPARIRLFEERVGARQLANVEDTHARLKVLDALQCGQSMTDVLSAVPSSCSEMARDAVRRIKLSQTYMQNAETVFSENGAHFPAAAGPMITDLTQKFNAINDAEEINQVQKEIVSMVDDASVGLILAKKVRQTIHRVRTKDALAARICLLSEALDGCVAREEHDHLAAFATPPGPLRKILTALVQRFESGAAPETALAGFGERELELLCAYFKVPREELGAVSQEYVREAARTRGVEEGMH